MNDAERDDRGQAFRVAAVRFERLLPGPAERVWAHLTQADKLSAWYGEDGVIAAIFDAIGVTNRFFVEFGAEEATECNTAHLLHQGWTGLMMDLDGISRNVLVTNRRPAGARLRSQSGFLSCGLRSAEKALAPQPRALADFFEPSQMIVQFV